MPRWLRVYLNLLNNTDIALNDKVAYKVKFDNKCSLIFHCRSF